MTNAQTSTPDQTTGNDTPSSLAIPMALLLTLGLLAAVGPFATDLYLPAMPQISDDLSTSASGAQLSLTAFLIGTAVGQLFSGPWSDKGRRRPRPARPRLRPGHRPGDPPGQDRSGSCIRLRTRSCVR